MAKKDKNKDPFEGLEDFFDNPDELQDLLKKDKPKIKRKIPPIETEFDFEIDFGPEADSLAVEPKKIQPEPKPENGKPQTLSDLLKVLDQDEDLFAYGKRLSNEEFLDILKRGLEIKIKKGAIVFEFGDPETAKLFYNFFMFAWAIKCYMVKDYLKPKNLLSFAKISFFKKNKVILTKSTNVPFIGFILTIINPNKQTDKLIAYYEIFNKKIDGPKFFR